MSRLDPLRERQDFLDSMEAEGERQVHQQGPQRERSENEGSRELSQEIRNPSVPSRPAVHFKDSRGLVYDRDRGYRLRDSEIQTLVDLGKFRVIAVADLADHSYGGQRDQMQNDLRNLLRQGLVRKGVFEGPEHTPRELLTLTKRGHRLVRASRMVPREQSVYYGFVKPREANHDADLYTLYNKEIARILKEGGRNPRVILDFELKRKINRDVAKLGREARPEIARSHGLRVVRGRIPVPDVRIEYEKPDGQMARIDLELVTEHYRGRSLADKVKAGFSLYTPRGEGDRLRRVLDGQELTAEIFSL
ncbi:MAG TPA: hypothetical protein VK829_00395 [Terriglobales bacterium]|jgi:hypothetical protein|nr:hypothetical protein [Terriglobales bacterium]